MNRQNMNRHTIHRRHALVSLAAILSGTVRAQADRTVKFILPNATASGVDTITRAAQGALAKALGHPVVIENQPGAGGVLGVAQLVRSAPDGFTLGVVSNNVVIYPSVIKQLPFDPIKDITPIAIIGTTPIVVVVNAKVPANNAKELVALLKARNGQLNYGSSGNGTILHLAAELFVDEAGAKANHIPYKGVGPMITDLIGGQVEMATAALPSIQSHLKSGALKAIGVGSAQRVAAAPEIATMAEQGMPGYLVEGWFAVIAPKGLPAADVSRVHAAVTAAFADAGVREAMARQGNAINVSTPEAAQAYFKSELTKYAQLVKKAGLEAQ